MLQLKIAVRAAGSGKGLQEATAARMGCINPVCQAWIARIAYGTANRSSSRGLLTRKLACGRGGDKRNNNSSICISGRMVGWLLHAASLPSLLCCALHSSTQNSAIGMMMMMMMMLGVKTIATHHPGMRCQNQHCIHRHHDVGGCTEHHIWWYQWRGRCYSWCCCCSSRTPCVHGHHWAPAAAGAAPATAGAGMATCNRARLSGDVLWQSQDRVRLCTVPDLCWHATDCRIMLCDLL